MKTLHRAPAPTPTRLMLLALPTLLTLLAASPASRAANSGFSVRMDANLIAEAMVFDGVHLSQNSQFQPFNSGNLVQTSLSSGLISVSARAATRSTSRMGWMSRRSPMPVSTPRRP